MYYNLTKAIISLFNNQDDKFCLVKFLKDLN